VQLGGENPVPRFLPAPGAHQCRHRCFRYHGHRLFRRLPILNPEHALLLKVTAL
jgi:hypothetical protein